MRETVVARILIPIGIILMVFSVFLYRFVDRTKDFIRTEAVVTKTELYEEGHYDIDDNYVEATYTITVRYMVDGKEYEEEYGIFSGMKEGDKVTVAYNPDDPTEIVQPTGFIWPYAMMGVGALSFAGGIASLIKAMKRRNKMIAQEEEWKNE